jgi:hypothetical protein
MHSKKIICLYIASEYGPDKRVTQYRHSGKKRPAKLCHRSGKAKLFEKSKDM